MPASKQHAINIEQAVARAPMLQQLAQRAQQSATRLSIIRPLLPAGLRQRVVAGASSDDEWCLLVPHHAAAAKTRQLLPLLTQALQAAGHPVQRIRVKIQKLAG